MIFCSVKLKCPEHHSINPSSTIHLKKIWNTNTSVAGLQPVMRFTVWSENYDQCFKKSKKILKLKTFSVCRLPWRHAHPDRSAVTMQSEQKRCRHSLVVMVFFSMSRQMGHISSLCRERGDTATSVPSMIASWTHTHTHTFITTLHHILQLPRVNHVIWTILKIMFGQLSQSRWRRRERWVQFWVELQTETLREDAT